MVYTIVFMLKMLVFDAYRIYVSIPIVLVGVVKIFTVLDLVLTANISIKLIR